MNKKAFTLIELLVVVLIIAILAAIALPKYTIIKDKARLTGLIMIGKNIEDAMNRYKLGVSDTAFTDWGALDKLDISFKDYQGNDCTSGSCRIKVSGKDYNLSPNFYYTSGEERDYINIGSYTDNAFSKIEIQEDTSVLGGYKYRLTCVNPGDYNSNVDVSRCQKLAESLGATSGCTSCNFNM